MKGGTLALLFFLQIGAPSAGVVTGVVRGADGMPAAGVRVYAIAAREGNEASNAPLALESLAQTDSTGRYRLEVVPGRYRIAAGSVDAPTYYPGSKDPASARVITVTSNTPIESIDIAGFVPAPRGLSGALSLALPPGSTGILGGVIRNPDGTPAAGVSVTATPTSMAIVGTVTASNTSNSPLATALSTLAANVAVTAPPPGLSSFVFTGPVAIPARRLFASTDANGRYRFEQVSPGDYLIAAGASNAPVFYPGIADGNAAKTITTIPTTNLDNLDFTLQQTRSVFAVKGRVTATSGLLPVGTSVGLTLQTPIVAGTVFDVGLPAGRAFSSIPVAADGTFEFSSVAQGTYAVETNAPGVRPATAIVIVKDRPVTDIEMSIAVAALSGRILSEDGSPFPLPEIFGEAIVTTVSEPNIIASTLLPISNAGTFGRNLDADEYRFYVRTLPEEYTIQSMLAGSVDLVKNTLKANDKEPTNVEIRVKPKDVTSAVSGVKVLGITIGNTSIPPASGERAVLCCMTSGPAERLSALIHPDGTFEFAAVPRGTYTVSIPGKAGQPPSPSVEYVLGVADRPAFGVFVASSSQVREVTATVQYEDGLAVPQPDPATLAVTGKDGVTRVAVHWDDGRQTANLFPGEPLTLSVIDIPEGYEVRSIRNLESIMPQPTPIGRAPQPPSPIVVTLARSTTSRR